MAKPRKFYQKRTSKGEKTIATTKWQKLVSKHGIEGAKKHYTGYKQVPAPPTTSGNIRTVKGGTRRVRDNKIGSGRRSLLYYKGDKVGTWTRSKGNSTMGRSGLGWYMERGFGTAKKPVPDTPNTRRLGIANKGKVTTSAAVKSADGMLVPGGVPGLNQEEEWETAAYEKRGKKIKEAEIMEEEEFEEEEFDAELTMWQRAVAKHGIPPAPRGKARGHGAFKDYRGRKQEDGVMFQHGDKVSTWDRDKGYSTTGVNTGRGWFMERGFGSARKPVPDTPLTRRLGIANAGRMIRDATGRFAGLKRMLVPSGIAGLNTKQDWEMNYFNRRRMPFFEAETGSCPNCGWSAESVEE